MNVFQTCPNTSELEPLYLPQQLYLRPIAKLNISLQLPNLTKLGKSVSHWEIMDKLKELIRPDEFTVLKVTRTTMEFVRLEAEVEKRSKLERVVSKINNKMIKLKDFADLMRVKAAETPSEFPNRRAWDAFFSEAKNMNEMKPGERPDTMHISNIPSKWFTPFPQSGDNDDDTTPSEKILYRVFEKFGSIRYVDIPICDPYRKKMKEHISGLKFSSFEKLDFFEGYIQFKDYIGFTKAMDFFRDKKLVHKNDGYVEIEIKVDFDKTKHLSDASIRRREIVRDRLVKKAREKEEKDKIALEEIKKQEEVERKKNENLKTQKEIRRRMREEKRKTKILQKLEITGSDEINEKIAKEEKKLVKVQRKLEAIRMVEELFKRIKEKSEGEIQRYNLPDPKADKLKRLKNIRELDYLSQKEKLHHAVKGRAMLKTILSDGVKTAKFSDSSDSELSLDASPGDRRVTAPMRSQHRPDFLFDGQPPSMYGFPFQPMYQPFGPPIYQDIDIFSVYRGARGRGRGRGRGFNQRGRGAHGGRGFYPPEVYEEYSNQYNRKRNQYSKRSSRSYSPRRSRNSRSRSRSHSHGRLRSRSPSRSRKRSRKSDRDSRSRSRSYRRKSRSRSRHRSRSKSRRSRSKSKNTRSASRSKSRDRKSKNRSHSRSGSQLKRSRSRSRANSVDSTKFMTPRELKEQKNQHRSKSWSFTEDGEKGGRSWSQSPIITTEK
ncbi:A-kinase anchor protein 17A [Dendroctonus ponderosae]|uniref:A-kinase anchor protein 17A n=1 Tax=Dendroctonus ponderosae TaxID=77166 RepID=UPI0020366362|nr:A-kinase anchor protein 17A [Dendroctonus ponderosae]